MLTIVIVVISLSLGQCIAQEEDITKGPPAPGKAWTPAPGFWENAPTGWKAEHERLVAQSQHNRNLIKIVFFGDSQVSDWLTEGSEIWDAHYANRGAYNYGIGGDTTRNAIWRIDHGELDNLTAKIVVLLIGTNNFNSGNDTEADVAEGIKVVVEKIKAKLPNAKIVLLGLLPRVHWLEDRNQEVNQIILHLNDEVHVFYLDMTLDFEESPGFEKQSLYRGDMHLSKAGYNQWYKSMDPLFKRLLDPLDEGDITHIEPAHDKPWVPAYGWWGPGIAWKFTHEELLHQSIEVKGKALAIFVGDQLTTNWANEGKDVWSKFYANRSAYTYGIPSDSTRQVLWRIQHGEFMGLDPNLVVLQIGTNNLYGDFNGNATNEEVALGIKAVVDELRATLKHANILIMGILPREEYFAARIQAINALIAKYHDGKYIHYIDISANFQESVGHLRADRYKANIELTAIGYEQWQIGIEALFHQLLGGH